MQKKKDLVFLYVIRREISRMEERYLKMMWQLRPLGIIYTCNPSHCFMDLVGEIAEQIPVAIVNNQNEKMNVDAVELIIQNLEE